MAEPTQITPFVMTYDLNASLAFFEDILGFTCGFRMGNYAFIRRGAGALRLLEVAPDCIIGEQMVYLDCADVDALFTELEVKLRQLPPDRLRAPFDQPYKMREFHVKDPDNCLLMFGTDIPPSP